MKTLNFGTVILSAMAGAAILTTAAAAMPADGMARRGVTMLEPARIVCEPFGRCFRIDPFGRRIFVPRPYGFGRPGFGGPEFGGPGFGGLGYGRPQDGRPGFDRPDFRRPGASGFGERDGRDARPDHENRRDDQTGQRRRPEDGGADRQSPNRGQDGQHQKRRQPQGEDGRNDGQ